MIEFIKRTAVETWFVMGEMAPYLLFGFLVAGILSVLIRPEIVERHLGKRSILSVFKAAMLGIPLPLCSCGVIPVTASLKAGGASRGAATAFLLSTPQTGVDSILVTYGMLGPVFAVFRPLAALAGGVAGGALVNALDPEEPESPDRILPADSPDTRLEGGSLGGKVKAVLWYAFYSLPRSLGKPLLAGFVVAGFITAVIPGDFFTGALGRGIPAMLAMLAAGIPVYVCSTASVPIAAALMAKGLSPGAALVFLMTGPATNAAALAMVWRVMGKRTTALFLAVTALSALASGLALDYIWSQGTLMGIHVDSEGHDMMSATMKSAAALVLIAILSLAFFGACGKSQAAKSEEAAGPAIETGIEAKPEIKETMTVNLAIKGMSCTNCENTLTKALGGCPGVGSAIVDFRTGKAVVKGDGIDPELLKAAVAKKGYVVETVEFVE